MKYDEFVDEVQRLTGIPDRAEAERTSVAVLQELCDRLTGDEARDLLSQLPGPLQHAVVPTVSALPISADDFVERVARELGVEVDEARRRVRAVFRTLREAVSPGEFTDVLEQLDPDYADLLA